MPKQFTNQLLTTVLTLLLIMMMIMPVNALAAKDDGGGDLPWRGEVTFSESTVSQSMGRGDDLPRTMGATYITSSDNVGDGGTGPADGDMYTGPSGSTTGVTTYGKSEVIEFFINVTGPLPTESAVLTIYGWDVDEEQGEVNYVDFNGHRCGRMTGANDTWNTTVFEIDKNWVQAGNNLVEYFISQGSSSSWVSAVDWGQLLIDGGVRARADIPQIVYLSQEQISTNTRVHTRIPVEIVNGVRNSDYFRLEVNFLDPAGNVVTSQTINNITGNTNDIIDQYVDITYPTNSASGTYWINANVFLQATNEQQVYKKMEFQHTQGSGASNDPEMIVSGAGVEIADGSSSISTSNYTDFGSVQVGNNFTRNFAIENTGSADLDLTGGSPYVSISGANAADFSVTSAPTTPIASGADKVYFSVTFTPSATGSRTATLSIANNDPNENPYNFTIGGTATAPPVPEINVTGGGNPITDGDTSPSSTDNTLFGSTNVDGGTISKNFVVRNDGGATLTVSNVNINGANAGDFSITDNPTGTINAGNSSSLTILFNPTAAGERNATVVITSDDADEGSFSFNIRGTGLEPEIAVTGGGQDITNGDTTPSTLDNTDFGVTFIGVSPTDKSFVISNSGNTNLTISSVTITGTNAADFSVITDPSGQIAASNSANLAIRFTPSAEGTRAATVNIYNNDINEGVFTFTIQGEGLYPREIDISGDGTPITDGDTTPASNDNTLFGSVDVDDDSTESQTFVIDNSGSSDLTISSVSISGANAGDFSVTDDPSGTIAGGGSANLEITFNPTAAGERNATVTVSNDDADEGTYTFAIRGTGYTTGINFSMTTNYDDADTSPGVQLALGAAVHWTYIVTNTGSVALSNIAVTDDTTGLVGTIANLAPGATDSVVQSSNAVSGEYHGAAIAECTFNGKTVSGSDDSYYTGLPSSISGLVWHDRDRDGIKEAGEPGLENVVVNIYNVSNLVVTSDTSDADGNYTLSELEPGDYTVHFSGFGAYFVVSPQDQGADDTVDNDVSSVTSRTATITLNTNENLTHTDCGVFLPAVKIGGLVWLDQDNDGRREWNFTPMSGIKAELYDSTNTKVGQTKTTGELGGYVFDTLDYGKYHVRFFNLPVGYGFTKPDVGPDNLEDSDPNPITGRTAAFTLMPGDSMMTLDAGILKLNGLISGDLFKDENGNGERDENEDALADVKMVLIGPNGSVVDSAMSDNGGTYRFQNVVPGAYKIGVVDTDLTSKFQSTTGGDTVSVTVEKGQNLNVPFGYQPIVGSLHVTLFTDENRDGLRQPEETVLPKVEIVLSDVAGNALQTVETGDHGDYTFTDLEPNRYQVSIKTSDSDLPNNFWPTAVSNPFGVRLTLENPVQEAMVGMNTLGTDGSHGVIGDYVWHDSNWNRQQDGDEEHLPYVMLYLYRLEGPSTVNSSAHPGDVVRREVFVDSVRTSYFGNYHFTSVAPGDYVVRAHEIQYALGEEWTITSRDSMFIHLDGGKVVSNADFGFANINEAKEGDITVFAFEDLNYDREFTDGEPGLADVTIDLYKKGELVASGVTDADGNASFEELPGDYVIKINDELVPENYVLTSVEDSEELFLPGNGEYASEGFGFAVEAAWGTTPNRIIAKYETWYNQTENGRYWDVDHMGGIADTSLIGLYNSNDADVVDYHILQAWANGIDGFAVNWFGWYAFEKQGLDLVLDRASALNEKYGNAGFHFEAAAALNENALGELDSNLVFIADSLLAHKAYWGTERKVKRPVFIDNTLEAALEPELLKTMADSLLPMDIMLAWNGMYEDSVGHMDVIYPSLVTDNYPWENGSTFATEFLDDVYTHLGNMQTTNQTGFVIGSVWPGFDDRNWVNGSDLYIDNADTTVYAQSWRKVLEYDATQSIPWVLVDSWNNFNNGTAIEPGMTHQYTLNKLTRDFARQYKAPELNPDSVGVTDLGLLVPKYIYIAKTAARVYPEKANAINQQVEQAYTQFFARNYQAAIATANQAAGMVPAQVSESVVNGAAITLNWQAVESANTYYIHIATDSASYAPCASIVPDMINVGNVTEYTLDGLDPETTYYIAITAGDSNLGRFVTAWFDADKVTKVVTGTTITGIEEDNALPKSFALDQNFPNPFNPVTTVRYALPKHQQVTIKLYNTLGQEVRTLVDRKQAAGYYNVQVDGASLGSGIYFYRIITNEYTATRKMLLVK